MRNKGLLTNIKWLVIYYGALLIWLGTTAMHIPDGYLSPVTSLIMFLLVLPFWMIGVRKIRESMNARSVPLIALLAAFSFVVMMFNIPLPGGTTGHATAAALAAIVLGPEVAVIAISIALIIQAFFFGDGGILAIGANCFNMAVVIPYISYSIYQAFAKNTPLNSTRRVTGAALGGWLGVTVAAFLTGVEFGLQPIFFHAIDGTPLYAPFPLSVAVPAMVIPHMLVASVVEGLLTALVVVYLQRSNSEILAVVKNTNLSGQSGGFQKLRGLWVGLVVLIVASPLGLLAPGTAWGEWSTQELTNRGLQTIPIGLQKLSNLWGAPLSGYDLPVLGNTNLGYVLSALTGIIIIGLVVWLFSLLLTGNSGSQKQGLKSSWNHPQIGRAHV